MDAEHAQSRIRELLWEWDFLHIKTDRSFADDEYDCLVGPLYRRLVEGVDSVAITGYLERELVDHFGLSPPPSAQSFVARLLAWWNRPP